MPRRAPQDAVTAAVALLGVRERTEAQLAAALRQRGHAERDITRALERVRELGYLDDARVAVLRARQGLSEGRSRADVTRRLAAQGIDPSAAEATVAEQAAALGQQDEAAARALLAKRRLTGARAARFLAARGFDEDLIVRVVDQRDEIL